MWASKRLRKCTSTYISDETVLGQEKTENRVRGKAADEVSGSDSGK